MNLSDLLNQPSVPGNGGANGHAGTAEAEAAHGGLATDTADEFASFVKADSAGTTGEEAKVDVPQPPITVAGDPTETSASILSNGVGTTATIATAALSVRQLGVLAENPAVPATPDEHSLAPSQPASGVPSKTAAVLTEALAASASDTAPKAAITEDRLTKVENQNFAQPIPRPGTFASPAASNETARPSKAEPAQPVIDARSKATLPVQRGAVEAEAAEKASVPKSIEPTRAPEIQIRAHSALSETKATAREVRGAAQPQRAALPPVFSDAAPPKLQSGQDEIRPALPERATTFEISGSLASLNKYATSKTSGDQTASTFSNGPGLASAQSGGVATATATTAAQPVQQIAFSATQTFVERTIAPQLTAALGVRPNGGVIEVMLDPPELGRMEIAIEIGENGLRAVMSAERSPTAELLKRHSELLAQQFEDAGFADVDIAFADRDASGSGERGLSEAWSDSDGDSSGHADVPANRRASTVHDGLDIRL